ncbi:limonene-1,2-epoxide hydrolase family protein [[Mycobacterium] burgundiense]|uniref:Limonene-1,2-epoxide hydrolase family protein n=1 Tax=[Mycobacterium] burgundiense TaxID=3064286 RepID=A0ABM9LWQ6_9MYCO|nr:limonene-1,2-epoxide hydrolase family protein [Mycolicibacterium sp. MU0053]CAJ1506003.1 limonene-1,2-epoxide hydrolase family protein [Mycolicibacterium sp. MU0053]
MTEQSTDLEAEANIAIVEKFFSALRDKDLDTADSLLADGLVYQNVGLPTIHGRRRAIKLFAGMQRPSMGFDVKIHRSAADGPTVLNERTDAITVGPVRAQFWVCGVFEVHDGRITLWRDYFDFFDITKGLLRGLLGVVIPALRTTL